MFFHDLRQYTIYKPIVRTHYSRQIGSVFPDAEMSSAFVNVLQQWVGGPWHISDWWNNFAHRGTNEEVLNGLFSPESNIMQLSALFHKAEIKDKAIDNLTKDELALVHSLLSGVLGQRMETKWIETFAIVMRDAVSGLKSYLRNAWYGIGGAGASMGTNMGSFSGLLKIWNGESGIVESWCKKQVDAEWQGMYLADWQRQEEMQRCINGRGQMHLQRIRGLLEQARPYTPPVIKRYNDFVVSMLTRIEQAFNNDWDRFEDFIHYSLNAHEYHQMVENLGPEGERSREFWDERLSALIDETDRIFGEAEKALESQYRKVYESLEEKYDILLETAITKGDFSCLGNTIQTN